MNETGILAAVFVAVLIVTFSVMSAVSRWRSIRSRLEAAGSYEAPRGFQPDDILASENAIIRHYFEVQKKNKPDGMEMRLIRAGFFGARASGIFIALRFAFTAALFVTAWYLIVSLRRDVSPTVAMVFAAILSGMAFILANAFLDRMIRANQTNYRRLFPDFMDLLIICVDAGLSIEAAIDRVAREFEVTKPSFSHHLTIISLEVRAGRPLHDALANFSTRVKVEEARTLATLFRQSQELGASVTKTLRVFSKEMRQKRLISAEEKANALPVKMLFPLAAFLFPVNLIIVLVPVMMQIMRMFLTLTPGN
jgi:tight adherence protein C